MGITIDQSASEKHSQERGVDYLVLKLNDNIIIGDEQIYELGQELYDYIDYRHPKANLCLDLKVVNFLSSTFLGKLMNADKKLKSSGRNPLGLRNVKPGVYEVFEITRSCRLFDIDKASKNAYEKSKERTDDTLTPEYSI